MSLNPAPLSQLADAACIATDGATAEGAVMLIDNLKFKYPDFYETKSSEFMVFWAQALIGQSRSRLRSQIVTPLRGRQTIAHQAVGAESLRSSSVAWYSWPVVPGVMLHDAQREHLQVAAGNYMRTAETSMKRGRWLNAIAEALPDDEAKVSDALTEDVIEQMAVEFGVREF